MKRSISGIIFLALFACDGSGNNNVTGSNNVIELPGAVFTVYEQEALTNSFSVSGFLENTSGSTYYPYWYIEGDFYSDSTFSLKFGGVSTTISHSLEDGVSTPWQLIYSSDLINEINYPDFAIKNLRVYKLD